MKFGDLKSCFCFSIGLHVAAFTTVMVAVSGRDEAGLLPEDSLPILSLIAAPDEPVSETKDQAPVGVVTPAQPPPQPPPEPPPPQIVVPTPEVVPKPKPTATLPEPAQIPPQPPPEPKPVPTPRTPPVQESLPQEPKVGNPELKVRGDGSSPEPGTDSSTVKASVSTRAHPSYRSNPEPDYPPTARRRGQEGTVLLSVTVGVEGKPSRVSVKQSSGFAILDNAALTAVQTWEFEAARVNSRPVESEIEVPVRFRLND